MFHAETKILSLPLKGSTSGCTTTSSTDSDAYGSTSGGCCMLIVYIHLTVAVFYLLFGKYSEKKYKTIVCAIFFYEKCNIF